MPSWGIHLATANEILKNIDIEDKNAFLIGNFLPDAERHVVDDFSIFVPYNITHIPEMQEVEGKLEKLPNFNKFYIKYKEKIENPLVLGYLTHLITDYYWNKLTNIRYTIKDEQGNCIGLKINNGKQIEADKIIRRKFKHNDFYLFEKYLIKENEYKYPIYKENLLEYIKAIEETKYIKSDFLKIVDYLHSKQKNKNEEVYGEYKLYTLEKIKIDYENSIKFIIDIFVKNKFI